MDVRPPKPIRIRVKGYKESCAALSKALRRFIAEKDFDANDAEVCSPFTPLFVATVNGMVDVVKVLLEQGADVDAVCTVLLCGSERKRTALVQAASDANVEILRQMIEHDERIAAREVHSSAVGAVCSQQWREGFSRTECLKLLLDSGARTFVDVKSPFGATPLHAVIQELSCAAATREAIDLIHLLLLAGADPTIVQHDQCWSHYTPLHLAAASSNPDLVLALCEHGVDADLRADHPDAVTPLFVAVLAELEMGSDDPETVNAVLKCGGNPRLETERGSPLALAQRNGLTNVTEALLRNCSQTK